VERISVVLFGFDCKVYSMSKNKPFKMTVEGRVFLVGDSVDVGERSNVVPGEFVGWASLSSECFEITDEEVFDLLNTAHARLSFLWDFLELHNRKTGSLEELGVEVGDNVEVGRDAFVICRIEESYLEDVIGDMDGGEMVLDSLEKYDTEVDVVKTV
jgi:hypothetical protein